MHVTGSVSELDYLLTFGSRKKAIYIMFAEGGYIFYIRKGLPPIFFRTNLRVVRSCVFDRRSFLRLSKDIMSAKSSFDTKKNRADYLFYEGEVVTLHKDGMYFDYERKYNVEFEMPYERASDELVERLFGYKKSVELLDRTHLPEFKIAHFPIKQLEDGLQKVVNKHPSDNYLSREVIELKGLGSELVSCVHERTGLKVFDVPHSSYRNIERLQEPLYVNSFFIDDIRNVMKIINLNTYSITLMNSLYIVESFSELDPDELMFRGAFTKTDVKLDKLL